MPINTRDVLRVYDNDNAANYKWKLWQDSDNAIPTTRLATRGMADAQVANANLDPEAKARASGSEREMGRARASENFSRSEREK